MTILFTGFAVLKDNKIGVFDVGSSFVAPAIHKDSNSAISDALAVQNQFHIDAQVVQVEVYMDNSVLLMTLDNQVLFPRVFDVTAIIDAEQFLDKSLVNNWVNFVYRMKAGSIGSFSINLKSKFVA
ncbi:hypothetical protein [Psychromonas sp. KJ10-2]|uniref:hypothetical protein n=1 Tax=Psychromonas sp. KJ10-2 TaxID=3391822 RepID=UPI0039B465DD